MEQYSNIPSELKNLKQWVNFSLVYNEEKGKNDKIPVNSKTLRNAMSNNSSTWSDFNTACNAINNPTCVTIERKENGVKVKKTINATADGIGLMLTEGDIYGIDLDHVIENGQLTDEAQDIINIADSYTEYSPSKTGIHILCKGNIPSGRRKVKNADGTDFEIYSSGRFLTVTGEAYGKLKNLEERTEQAKIIHKKYFPQSKEQAPNQTISSPVGTNTDYSDTQLIFMASTGKNASRFVALWNGDTSGYGGNHSDADFALVNDLAYWTNGDAERIDRLFRQSGLMRDKWDRMTGSLTYGELTIQNALRDFTPYEKKAITNAPTFETANPNYNNSNNTVYTEQNKNTIEFNLNDNLVSEYLKTEFIEDLEKFKHYKDRKTGFSNLDELSVGLYPGLYVVGAISSLGKTTFIHQIADQLASAGDHILFFSLEQSKLEMITKSISRITGLMDRYKAVSAIDIRKGKITDEVMKATDEYYKIADRVSVIKCNFDTNINYIINYTKQFIKNTGIKPIVIVDYIQIIPPTDPRQSDKEKIDNIVRGLKKLQSENDLVMFAVSSINRSNYLTPIDFESFKESGGIEYTADVVWGLQLQILNNDIFNKPNNIKQKRDMVRTAKKDIPRKIELICLKNRYGISSYSCGFKYYPTFDYFEVDKGYIPEGDFGNFLEADITPKVRK